MIIGAHNHPSPDHATRGEMRLLRLRSPSSL